MLLKVVKKEVVKQTPEDVYDISVENHHNFILKNGVIVHNCDTFQSASIGQDFISKGYNYQIISVDRTNSDHICEPYSFFKNCIYEQRITLLPSKLLVQELVGLERNGNTGKIDHPDGGTSGSKDQSDAICGALWNASQHAEEYAFDFGENLELLQTSNQNDINSINKQQIIVDLGEELKNLRGAPKQGIGLDFGFGRAVPLSGPIASDGMLVW